MTGKVVCVCIVSNHPFAVISRLNQRPAKTSSYDELRSVVKSIPGTKESQFLLTFRELIPAISIRVSLWLNVICLMTPDQDVDRFCTNIDRHAQEFKKILYE